MRSFLHYRTWLRDICAHALVALFASVALLALPATVGAQSKGDIIVVTVHGTASATMAGATAPLYAGAILQLPATLRTGRDGSLELRQGPTTVAAAANTELEIPASAAAEGLIERIIQVQGNAFYSVGKRERTKLRVETPYLVAVIKGTQFNVAAQEDGTTIALFEGRLEVRATDESDVVDLNAGEIAIRNRNDVSIRVLRMVAGAPGDAQRDQATARTDDLAGSSAGNISGSTSTRQPGDPGILIAASADETNQTGSERGGSTAGSATGAGQPLDVGLGTAGTNVGIDAQAEIGNAKTALGLDAGIDAVNGSVDAAANVNLDLGVASTAANVTAAIDLGSGNIAAGTEASLSLGSASVDAGVDVATDLGAGTVAASVDTSVDLGSVGATVAADTAIDLGAGSVTADVGTAVDLGAGAGLSADTSASIGGGDIAISTGADLAVGGAQADLGIDTSMGTTNIATDVAATADLGVTDVAVDTGVDLAAGDVSAGVDVGGIVDVDVDVGVDLGSGTIDLDIGGGDTGGGLLNGLLNRRGRN